ncbi:tyrosinase [Ilyonectria robusta]
MYISLTAILSLVGASTLVLASADQNATDTLVDLNNQAIEALQESENTTTTKRSNGCSIFNASIRRDWKYLSPSERTAYINAVTCMTTKPSKADPAFAPGARTRYDDFVAVHINQTLSIHGTGNFFTWHRYFTWAYETALRTECGYKGTQPYWNWFESVEFKDSPLFDGSATSMSGDGTYVAHNGSLSGLNNIYIPSGNGGGCLKDGPFKGLTVNLGPVSPGMDGMEVSPTGALGYNPRCLVRDLSRYPGKTWFTASNLFNLTLGAASGSIALFQNEFQGRFGDEFLGVHAAGHFTMGGDSADLFSSPNDPIFFLHHAMVDRMYWVWQALHPAKAKDIAGTITILNTPPSRDAIKSDALNMGVNAPEITIGDALDTLGNSPFCYIYL